MKVKDFFPYIIRNRKRWLTFDKAFKRKAFAEKHRSNLRKKGYVTALREVWLHHKDSFYYGVYKARSYKKYMKNK